MRSAIGIIGFIFIVVAAILYGSPLSIFIDIPSIVIVLGTIFFLALSKYSFTELRSCSDEVVLSLINFSLLGGAIGFVIGMIQMLQNMSDPSSIGPATAVCLLTIFYGLVIAAGLYAMKKSVKTRKIGVLSVVGSLATLLPFCILMLVVKNG